MHTKGRFPNVLFGGNLRPESAALAILFLLLFLIFVFLFLTLTAQPAQAQTYKVIYNFTGGVDGSNPSGNGLTIDQPGNLYGTASAGGLHEGGCRPQGCGTVFKLTPNHAGWIFNALYQFRGGSDGYWPLGPVTFGPDGGLYGTTSYEGGGSGCYGGQGCGIVFRLISPPTVCQAALCPWTETVLDRFDGVGNPAWGGLTFDQAGNIYGTKCQGDGGSRYGNVYELMPNDGSWTESVLHTFDGDDGNCPLSGVIFDKSGNLYGTTQAGGLYGFGTVYNLTPSPSGWQENVLRSLYPLSDGSYPFGDLIMDQSGNLYGTTSSAGHNGGTVFELTPSSGSWEFTVLYTFAPNYSPQASLVMDAAGNLYGTTDGGGPPGGLCPSYGCGSIFELTPSGGGWTYTLLHQFTGGSDGANPQSRLVLDANGNFYGATVGGGTGSACDGGCGVVFEITP
jgi:uncharacterized repeat protein (TIGR03803 family)